MDEIAKLLNEVDEQVTFHLNNARYYFKNKEYQQAIPHYEKLLTKSPSHFEALFHLAESYKNIKFKKGKQWPKSLDMALAAYKKAYLLNPRKSPGVYLELLYKKRKYLEKGKLDITDILKEIHSIEPNKKDAELLVELCILKGESIKEVPGLSIVEKLDLKGKELIEFPIEITGLKGLKKIDLRDNKIGTLIEMLA